jgi:serine-type D-Ala-D-Ala carboxypeptidase/endopeptidase (penicillin-binding protein 4)
MKYPATVFGILLSIVVHAQVSSKLQQAFQEFEKDEQLRHAISSLYVIDANSGEVMFDRNSLVGLAPASTQKIITSVSAFELLGRNYRYQTKFVLQNGRVIIIGSGDPTLGSWRWENTREDKVLDRIISATRGEKDFRIAKRKWDTQYYPDGWMIQDIGNYYGAGALALNWRENQFDMFLKSKGNLGDTVSIIGYNPRLYGIQFRSEVVAAKKGSGDNAYIYADQPVVRGTIPVNEDSFKISGSIPDPPNQFLRTILSERAKIRHNNGQEENRFKKVEELLHTEYSPPLDSIIYWFNKKSINLYGEAFVKTIAYEKQGFGRTDSGISIIKKFWSEKGLDENELNIYDGSGLSPLNRVTTHAQVEILKFAKSREWFPAFVNSLPEYNGMTIKSGTISDVKGFCGYHKSKKGKEYIFSFLVNNYSGPTSQLISKMYKVLDVLK